MLRKLVDVKQWQIAVLMLTLLSLLSGCGFHLRGHYLLPDELSTIYLSSEDKHGELTRIVKQHFILNKVDLAAKSRVDIPELRILKDDLNRRTLSLFPNGQVAEYELIYTVRYQLAIANQDVQQYSFELNRDYQDDPDRALAKSRELALILSELRKAAADRILRNLASYQPSN